MIFWDVDTQVDFIDPRGKLYVPGAETIVPNLRALTKGAAERNILVIADVCAHQPDDEEFQIYPPHCLAGSPGQKKIPETLLSRQYIVPSRKIQLSKDLLSCQQVVIEKQTTDVFHNPNTEALLQILGAECEIILYGVVTEICVDLAARGLLQRGYRVQVVQDAVRHWDEARSRDTLWYVEQHGGSLVTTADVVARLR
jgi:nicotinamidase/pyrazinamidase